MRPLPVYLHIGLKKTGTSYLQGVAWASYDELIRQGLAVVPGSQHEAFELVRDARGRYDDDADAAQIGGSLARLPEVLRRAAEQGATRALLTQESLSVASPTTVARVLETLSDHDVHVVLTVRDLGRQVPSAWQQAVKARSTVPFDDFVEAVVAGKGKGTGARGFRLSQDVVGVTDRWAPTLPADRVHVVTVPPRGTPSTVLAHRFFGLLGVDADGLTTEVSSVNASIGRVQAELLARINAILPEEALRRAPYGEVGKRYFAERVLGAQQGEPPRLPRERQEWCRATAERTIAILEQRGYAVTGDLTDLLPRDDAFADEPVVLDGAALLAAAEQALAQVLSDRIEQAGRKRARTRAQPSSGRPGVLRRALARVRDQGSR
ncbi:hypothetical protein ABLE68_05750 [Nocardioides sp. CN2-186]|uniref:hypothetical protein n=1 Tax=Nocardioides tweenelious TaxID=3156607 RepID=UPI0032B43410